MQPADNIVKFVGKSGFTYKVQESLSAARYVKMLVFEKNMQYGRSVEQTAQDLNDVITLFNKGQIVDGSVKLVNLRDGVLNIGRENSFVLLTAALFCNTDKEDITSVNMDLLNEKIADWGEFDFQDFFIIVARLLPGCFRVYEMLTQAITEMPGISDLSSEI